MGHERYASAPSWCGKWLGALLRSAGIPRHALRLRDTDEALRDTATEILIAALSGPQLVREVHNLVARTSGGAGGASTRWSSRRASGWRPCWDVRCTVTARSPRG